MRTILELDFDEQQTLVNWLRDHNENVEHADEYEIYDEDEVEEYTKDYVLETIMEIENTYGNAFAPRLSDVMDVMRHYEMERFFIEIGVGMYIRN